jgi:hypothetical protein
MGFLTPNNVNEERLWSQVHRRPRASALRYFSNESPRGVLNTNLGHPPAVIHAKHLSRVMTIGVHDCGVSPAPR